MGFFAPFRAKRPPSAALAGKRRLGKIRSERRNFLPEKIFSKNFFRRSPRRRKETVLIPTYRAAKLLSFSLPNLAKFLRILLDQLRPRFRKGSGKYGLNADFFVRKNFLKKFFQSVLPARFGQKPRGEFGGGFGRDISTTFLEAESLGGGVEFSFWNWMWKLGAKLVQRFWRPNHSAGG